MKTFEQAHAEIQALSESQITAEIISPILSQVSPEDIQKLLEELEKDSSAAREHSRMNSSSDPQDVRQRIINSVEIDKLTGHYNPNDDAYNDAMVQSAFSGSRTASSGSYSSQESEPREFANRFDKIISVIKMIQDS